MRERCSSARFLFITRLDRFKFAFNRTSQKRRCGVADILPEPGGQVLGVVYHIKEEDRPALDRVEAVGVHAYEPFTVTLHPAVDCARRLDVSTCVVVTKENP